MPPASLNCLGLPVFTQTGIHLGKVIGVEVEAAARQVVYYQVKKTPQLFSWGKPDFLISPGQVVSLNSDRMTVKDAVKKQTSLESELMVEPTV